MKINWFLFAFIFSAMVLFSSCGNSLKKDAQKIGDLMCRNIEVMSKLNVVKPDDTVTANTLHKKSEELQKEVQEVYKAFNEKYKDQINSAEFNKKFSLELKKAMLDCPYLSKQDKAQFEKELKEK